MYKMNRTFFYKTSQCHTLLSKHLGCLKIPDISSSISKPSPRKKKWITLSFKTYLSVVFCMTADSFFHFDIYRTRRIARAGLTQGWWRPVFCSWQQTAPAASKEQTRSSTASGNLKINLWEIFSQLPWVENSFTPGGKKVCRSCFSFFSSFFPFFFRVYYHNSAHSWYLYKILDLFDCCEALGLDDILCQRQVNWNWCETLCPCISTKCHLPVSASLLCF